MFKQARSLFALSLFLLIFVSPAAWSANNGVMDVDDDTTACPGASGPFGFEFPNFDVVQGSIVHINVSPAFSICTTGASNKLDDRCDNQPAGYCDQTFNCQNNFGTCVGRTCSSGPLNGQACSSDAACSPNCTGSPGSRTCQGTSVSCTSNANCVGLCGNPGTCNGGGNAGGSCTSDDPCRVQTCNGGPNDGTICTANSQCTLVGTCESALNTFCDPDQESLFISGHAGICQADADCDSNDCVAQICDAGKCSISNLACTVDADCPSLCSFNDEVVDSTRDGTGPINVCYNAREDWCGDAEVRYCEDTGNSRAQVENPQNTDVFVPAGLLAVDSNGEPADCAVADATCVNEVGSQCCGLTQGAFGAPNSVATSLGTNPQDPCSGDAMGFLVSAFCGGCNVFNGDPNGSTVGVHPSRSVTMLGTDFFDSLNALICYLPGGGPAKALSASTGDKHYPPNPSCTNTKGDGGGVLTGQAMATSLNAYLSDVCSVEWPNIPPDSFTPSGFGGFELPATGELVCTRRSGPNKVLGDTDDVCQSFAYPNCVAEQSVNEVLAAANTFLGTGANSLGCTATELNNALSNINVQFDQCGEVIDCGSVTTPTQFACP